MNLTLTRDSQLNLVVRMEGGRVLRWLLGVPILLFGGLMAFGTISSFVIRLTEEGMAALPTALVGSFVLALFAALLLPLGFWILFSKRWFVLKSGTLHIADVTDWMLGSREKVTEASRFRAVRLALEPIDTSPHAKSTSVYVERVRLVARDPARDPSIELGWMKKGQRAEARAIAEQVAAFLRLPLEEGQEGEIILSPAQEEAERESLEEN